jgi:membrane protease YdiL (CAAX protease family)
VSSHLVEQHSFGKSLLLHLLPGLLIGGVYFALRSPLAHMGFPSLMALLSAILLILLPFELGLLLREGRKKNGRISLQGVVLYQKPIPTWQYFVWVPVLFVLLGLVFTLMKPVDAFLHQMFFTWLPTLEGGLQAGYSRTALIFTWSMMALFGVLTGPIVEELYFRGYLLPRMGYAGKWAPLLHCFFFGLYHFWTPRMFLTRILGMLPLVYAVRWRNLNLAIIVHVMVNALDIFSAVAFIARMSSV